MPQEISFSVGALSLSRTLSDAHAARVLAWARARFGAELTNQQLVDAVGAEMFEVLRANVVNHERQEAATTAAAGVAGIDLT